MVGIPAFDRWRLDLEHPTPFEYSKRMFEGTEMRSALVYSVVTAPNGTLVATVIHYANEKWEKQRAPAYFLSKDQGQTWQGPRAFKESATVQDIAYTMDTSFVHDGEIFIVFRGGIEHDAGWTADFVFPATTGSLSVNAACCPSTTPLIPGPPARSTTAKSLSTPTTPI